MRDEDLRVDLRQTGVNGLGHAEVTVTHLPTGLSVTKMSSSQLLSKREAIAELEKWLG